ncbi:MmgE/PrpD family protein [Amycolatopsis jejuensis]|uniref:MmgE/PrpD family protein n=1 Tax=Amycolatopsis jejuensis TaxID=330084 RepID=UPI00068B379D|nr:MmgE/PrpD family protein [Amycolatopsis jejuensis]
MPETAVSVACAVNQLADLVTTVRHEDLPPGTRRRAGQVIADTVGVGLAGARTEPVRTLLAGASPSAEAQLLTTGFRPTTREEAMTLNALAVCATELDEGTRPTGHPAMHLLPAALAVAQHRHLPGRDLVTALVLGYEVQSRLQWAFRLRDGVHCHGNFGTVGVAAALARLTGLSSAQTRHALNGAAGMIAATSYASPYAGASMHTASPALSVQSGALAVRLATAGYTGYEHAVSEGFGCLLGTAVDPDALTADLGSRWAVDSSYVKFHSTCGHVHPVLDALIDALGQGPSRWLAAPVDPQTVRSLTVRVSVRAAELNAIPEQPSPLAARFSIPLSAAAFLLHGHAGPDAFAPSALARPDLIRLARTVSVVPDGEYDRQFPDRHLAEVTLTLTDGRELHGRCENPYGNNRNPASTADVRSKFLALTADSATGPALWDRLTDLDSVPDVSELLAA